ncbi:Kynureninase (L-kynurenine hydrolase) [Tilletia horrida]|uniref:Kynureninase n=1 Tax=Tilletia horrida TaxID=155126 RepID=A0AAN6GPP7_9BASI|nr:Kynureninase (L-kynurenine hydrolase) [Tilletia horrida]KAK0547436.1 Kynureninase (L-kynurenine hydrolase) [Tilletia horrida]KAK0561896.1 Kynureninase (L-kynurenine hydrolase) [Tilletia horrida]
MSSKAQHRLFTTDAFEAELAALRDQKSLESTADHEIATLLDAQDDLASLRNEYNLPSLSGLKAALARKSGSSATNGDSAQKEDVALYLCGNSLGPQPRRSKERVQQEMDVWADVGVLGHFDHPHQEPWTRADDKVNRLMADIVGAKPSEVAAMGTLTTNLHSLLATFYRPSSLSTSTPLPSDGSILRKADGPNAKRRHKIVYEWKAFPSDQYAIQSVVRLNGLDPEKSLVPLRPRKGEDLLRTEDVLSTLNELAEEGETAILMLSGIQYYTGQFFDIQLITRTARQLGIVVGWDLAHAFGNVPLSLHDWDVDFAAWCTYKYGSSGPGGIAGIFVHERWTKGVTAEQLPRPAGWFGHSRATRFAMPPKFEAMDGAAGFIISNPSALDLAALLGSLETLAKAPLLAAAAGSKSKPDESDLFSAEHADSINAKSDAVGEGLIMPALRAKSLRLTAYLAHLVLMPDFFPSGCSAQLVTPQDPQQRGSQLNIRIIDHSASTEGSSVTANGSASAANGEDAVPAPLSPKSLLARAHRRAEREHGLIVDVRAPDVIRIAPLAQYSTYTEVWRAAHALKDALTKELADGA